MAFETELTEALGASAVLTGEDCAPYGTDWMKLYPCTPRAVVRPGSTAEVSACVQIAARHGVAVVPMGGNTGLAGGTYAEGAMIVSMERMNRILEIRPESRVAIVEAGVVLSQLHEAAQAQGLTFPLTFGARGSARIGGCLSTNAGGSNVLRYGSTRSLCFGLEVVLASGEVMNLQNALHKDNTGYALKDLFIGAEGTLGLITAATLKLVPLPTAYATAMVAVSGLDAALALLRDLQSSTGGLVEAFEYMPRDYMEQHAAMFPAAQLPFDPGYDHNILVEIGATAARDVTPAEDGSLPLVTHLEETLGAMIESGDVLDAVVAQSDAQRRAMWERREAAAEVTVTNGPVLNVDIALPIDAVGAFIAASEPRLHAVDPNARCTHIAHLGDGNIHLTVRADRANFDALMEAAEGLVQEMNGSFSAEHGIGLSKKPSMARRKDPVALQVMRQIKMALDPDGVMNPGKVVPEP